MAKKTVAKLLKPEPPPPLVTSKDDADEKVARIDAHLATYAASLSKVVNAEGLFEPKIAAIDDLNKKITGCLEKRGELLKAKAELKEEEK